MEEAPSTLYAPGSISSPFLRSVYGFLGVWWVIRAAIDPGPARIGLALFGLLVICAQWWRPGTVVDRDGIRRPPIFFGLPRHLAWDEVEAVVRPTPFTANVRVQRVDGRVLTLPFAKEQAPAIAAVGGKPLVAAPESSPAPPPPPAAVREPSVQRRLDDVRAEADELRRELERLRRHSAG